MKARLPRLPWRRALPAAGLLLAVAALGAGVFVAVVPVPAALEQPVGQTCTLLDSAGQPLAEWANAQARSQHPVALADMGADLPRVTVALEDRRFYQHAGIDWRRLLAAAGRNLLARRALSGASTLTEQLVKLSAAGQPRRTLLNKAREAAAAWKLERRWGKDAILARYLNVSSYGNRLLGPEAAARGYFGKPARALTLAEAVYLAGLPRAPSRLNPWGHPAAAEYQYQRNVRRLAALGVLNAEEARRLADAPPKPGRCLPARRAGHFVDLLRARWKRITTTENTESTESTEDGRGRKVRLSFPSHPLCSLCSLW